MRKIAFVITLLISSWVAHAADEAQEPVASNPQAGIAHQDCSTVMSALPARIDEAARELTSARQSDDHQQLLMASRKAEQIMADMKGVAVSCMQGGHDSKMNNDQKTGNSDMQKNEMPVSTSAGKDDTQ
ncbi:MAG TPA: hypothetical protein VEK08_13070 [Planctomycetota bacterium]|nr:hypothetical protein [Planctomycetota bacterium]